MVNFRDVVSITYTTTKLNLTSTSWKVVHQLKQIGQTSLSWILTLIFKLKLGHSTQNLRQFLKKVRYNQIKLSEELYQNNACSIFVITSNSLQDLMTCQFKNLCGFYKNPLKNYIKITKSFAKIMDLTTVPVWKLCCQWMPWFKSYPVWSLNFSSKKRSWIMVNFFLSLPD